MAEAPRSSAGESARALLRRVFGFGEFRGQQEAVVDHVVEGGDAVVLMPTGGGKSLCYQVPALLRPGVGVVVSPLIALMQDQVGALRQHGVRAAFVNSSQTAGEAREVERSMVAADLDLLYVAPERLTTPRFLELLARTPLALFAIDEAHCVSQWGHDFRPEYLQLAVLGERHPGVPRLALTATADDVTRREIAARLGLARARLFVSGFDRPNVRYRVVPKREAKDQLLRFLRTEHPAEPGIVYCRTRQRVDDTAVWLERHGMPALPYHAGLEASVRQAHQERFLHEEGLVMVATVAFGMGIDKPDVRFVAHLDPPKSVEAYYQETGRAGRDGLPASAWMTYGLSDVVGLRRLLAGGGGDGIRRRVELQRLEALLGFCETAECRRRVLLGYFGEAYEAPCDNCDNCLEPVESWDATVAAQKALSCVARTGERFGASHLTDVLLGKATDRVRSFGHDRLSTFGIGADLAEAEWRSAFRQLAATGLLEVDLEGHGGLRLGRDSRAVLRGERPVSFRKDPLVERGRGGRRRERPTLDGGDGAPRAVAGGPAGAALFELLRARRLELARAQGVPPYVIFHDSTLLEIARLRPRTAPELAQISGVGARKLERYGTAFLEVVAACSG
ncbi:MAG: DNA helicase RecQ [Gemmatimonadota bacterium]